MKKYSLSVYEKAMPSELSWADKLYSAKKAGFDAIEISIDETDDKLSRLEWDYNKQKELLSLTRDIGVFINTMCLSGHRKYPLGSKEHQTRAIEIAKNAVEFSYNTGIKIIQLAGYDVYYEPSDEDTIKRFEENLQKCVEFASAYGVILGFETMETPFMNTVTKAMKYVNAINSPYLKVYPDIGNISNATSNVAEDILNGSGHIVAAHLKETKKGIFRDMMYGDGSVDFKLCIDTLKQLGVRFYNAEFWYDKNVDYNLSLKRANDFLRNLLD